MQNYITDIEICCSIILTDRCLNPRPFQRIDLSKTCSLNLSKKGPFQNFEQQAAAAVRKDTVFRFVNFTVLQWKISVFPGYRDPVRIL